MNSEDKISSCDECESEAGYFKQGSYGEILCIPCFEDSIKKGDDCKRFGDLFVYVDVNGKEFVGLKPKICENCQCDKNFKPISDLIIKK